MSRLRHSVVCARGVSSTPPVILPNFGRAFDLNIIRSRNRRFSSELRGTIRWG